MAYQGWFGREMMLSGLLLIIPAMLPAEDARQVKTARLSAVAIYPQKTAPATVVSLNNTHISAQISARVDAINVRVGEVVAAGQPLARLDCTDHLLSQKAVQAQIASLKARIELAGRRLARAEKLTRKQTVSEERLDEREADLAVLRADHDGALAQLEMAKVNVSRCTIKSPYKAVITDRIGSVGEFARPGTHLIRVMDLEQLEISAQVPARDIEQIGDTEELYFEDSAHRYALMLRTVVPAVNTQTRNREARLLFRNGPALPGAAGKLIWRDNRPHVPGKLLVRRSDDFGVFVNNNGRAEFHILPNAQQGRATPVPFSPDTVLVTEGQHGLEDSQAISSIQ